MKQNLEKLVDLANELDLSPAQRWMMTVLILLAGRNTSVATSVAELASAYGSNDRNTARMLAMLMLKPRLLRVEKSRNESGQAQPNRYSFPFLDGTPAPIAPLKTDELEAL